MFRCYSTLFVAALCAGCVPVNEPVGDIDKAEPNKDFIGAWKTDEAHSQLWFVDRPEVKGNPKGLMRVRIVDAGKKAEDAGRGESMWIFSSKIGDQTYVNALLQNPATKDGFPVDPDFSKEGAYAEWRKSDKRGFYVAHLEIRQDVVTVDPGNFGAFQELMRKENFTTMGSFYKTDPAWLTRYLEKNGPKGIFDAGKGKNTFTRVR